jgi:predicted GIY-YIG superfamily endonuclease
MPQFGAGNQLTTGTAKIDKNSAGKNRKLRLMWHLYIIKQTEKFYTGITTDLKNRLHQHGNPPLLYKEPFPNKHLAAQRERQIKGWSKEKKQDLIKGLIR